MTNRPVPLLGDISLEYVQRVNHSLEGGFASTRIANLPGELQQRSGRPSHRVEIAGMLFGDEAGDQLQTLQTAAANGEELTFAADIVTALDLQKVVITGFHAVELGGEPGRYAYSLTLAESPPLPPPAEVSGFGFGGLDDFGLGDLGFDTDILGDLTDLASDIAGAVDDALGVIDALSALANIGDLAGIGGLFEPLNQPIEGVGEMANELTSGLSALSEAFTS
jgi:hypothetical protein